MPEALTELEGRRRAWIAAVNARDVEAYAAMLTEDVVWIPPGQPAVEGRDAFKDWVRPFFEAYRYGFDLTDIDCWVAGDRAVERGRFRTRMEDVASDQSFEHEGEYLVLWRRGKEGPWRIERYVDLTRADGPGE